ncbi:MAG: T9SS type A sorting domain-containing protein [Cyclobacteriaceae bacterium]|nr:T9SS type A sorting domain-containing protein [Cyclobacteriaceae bacterium]
MILRNLIVVSVLFCVSLVSVEAQRFPLSKFPKLQGMPLVRGSVGIQSSGKYIIGGEFSRTGSTRTQNLVRLNMDGSIDSMFNYFSLGFEYIGAVAIDNQDRIMVGGYHSGGTHLMRLNPDGTIDNTFNTVNSFQVLSIDTLSSNQYIVQWYAFGTDKILTKLNEDGSVDSSFSIGAGPNGYGTSSSGVTPLKNGQIINFGVFNQFNSQPIKGIVRLNTDGTVDDSFTLGGGPTSINYLKVTDVFELADGKIMVSGSFDQYNGVPVPGLVRLNPDGSIDDTFIPYGGLNSLLGSVVNSMAIYPDGTIALASLRINGENLTRVVHLNGDGSLKLDAPIIEAPMFLGMGIIEDPSLIALSQNELFLTGTFSSINGVGSAGFGKISNYITDSLFHHEVSGDARVNSMKMLSDSSYIAVGNFIGVNKISTPQIVLINADGTVNQSFTTNLGTGFNNAVHSVQVLKNGDILIGGIFNQLNGEVANQLVKLNPDGTRNYSFISDIYSTTVGPTIKEMMEWTENKLLIYGGFTNVGTQGVGGIARLNSDGSYDNNWQLTFGADTIVTDVEWINTGELLIAGNVSAFDIGGGFILKVDTAGVIDQSFSITANLSAYKINDLAIDSSGNIYAAGRHSSWSGRPYVIQMDSIGVLKDNFSITTTDGYSINKILPYRGDLLIGGWFSDINNNTISGIARVSTNGEIYSDLNLSLTSSASNIPAIYGMELYGDSLLIYGKYNGIDEKLSTGYSMIDMLAIPAPRFVTANYDHTQGVLVTWEDKSNLEEGQLFYRSTNGGNFVLLADLASDVTSYLDTNILPDSTYVYQVKAYSAVRYSDFSTISEMSIVTVPLETVSIPEITFLNRVGDQIEIIWSMDTLTAIGVELYRSTGGTGDYILMDTLFDNTVFHDQTTQLDEEYFYKMRAFNLFSFSDYSITQSLLLTGFKDWLTNTITVYPNPTSNLLHINLPEKSYVTLLDINGRLLQSFFTTEQMQILNMVNYKDGIYLLQVTSNGKSIMRKVVKE